MSSETANLQTFNKREPIPGYVIQELIGTGGYGEVWKANAPGGLLKAIKFVYGSSNAKRAARELRSLNRIKEARHPFLLSIERIEVIDDNVIIVTELADESLKQKFDAHRANGARGIPRDELLSYLRDAADALDYIYENYSLQHLDVKPENLLLISGRAKVGDFGLIKNLYERSASLIEGLTPVYSPPELFAGQPNRNSDQYSLAIVFQEMLTGELPFDGMTAAHLAAQHLNMPPRLTDLPKADQPIIARALSKDPDERFSSCRALIDALAQARAEETPERAGRSPLSISPPSKTEPLGEMLIDTAALQPLRRTAPVAPVNLPPIELDAQQQTTYGPVLFIGIGGTAARVLRRLRRRFHDRLGERKSIPAIEFLLLDTDVKNINAATEGEPGTALHVNETLAMPLRRAEDYRSSARKILGSTSRRWLYNIPFSLQTEGFRPLGRLAMMDHCTRLFDRMRRAIHTITSEAAIAATAQKSGLDFRPAPPRVFIVASIAGGTGGGMVLDVAYAARTILAEHGLSDDHVYGMLMHSTARGAGERDKALANAYATLNELWHYSRAGHCYPGDAVCGLPPFHGNNRTFSNCYLVHLGDELSEPRLDAATDPVAEYLYASAVTPAVGFFDKCRQLEQAVEQPEATLRTIGLCQLGGSNSDIPALLAEVLCRDLAGNWRSGAMVNDVRQSRRVSETTAVIAAHNRPKSPWSTEIAEQAAAKCAELQIDLERLERVANQIVDQEVGPEVSEYFQKLIGEAFNTAADETDRQCTARVFNIIEAVLGTAESGNDDNADDRGFDSLSTVLNTRLQTRAAKWSTAVRDWLYEQVNVPTSHVEGAKHAAEWFQSHLRSLDKAAMARIATLREQSKAIKESELAALVNKHGAANELRGSRYRRDAQARVLSYATICTESVKLLGMVRCLRMIDGQVTTVLDRLQEFWKDLNKLAATFNVPPSLIDALDRSAVPEIVYKHWRSLLSDLMARHDQLVSLLDKAIDKELNLSQGKLQYFATEGLDISIALSGPMRAAARKVILRTMEDLNIARISSRAPGSPDDAAACVEAAKPTLSAPTGASRLLVIVPQSMDAECVRASLAADKEAPATILQVCGGDLVACQEVEQLPLRDLAAQLVRRRRDYIEIARRLHTRSDIAWDDMSKPGSDVR